MNMNMNTPLGFLHAALPHVPIERLIQALDGMDPEAEDGDMDMWDVIAGILSDEYVREMEERGLDPDNVDEDDDDSAWETVDRKKPPALSKKKQKQKHKLPTKKIPLTDVLQKHHRIPAASSTLPRGPASDAWTHLTSLSTHLSSLLPPHPPNYFLSYFHDPARGRTPYEALCAALRSCNISTVGEISIEEDELGNEEEILLLSLYDIVQSMYPPPSSNSKLLNETRLALRATQGRGEDALEVVKLLRELDPGYEAGWHAATTSRTPSPASFSAPTSLSPPVSQSSPVRAPKHRPLHTLKSNQWRTVPSSSFTPAASRPPANRDKLTELLQQRNLSLREAARTWQRGNRNNRGGEVAGYYAERVRFSSFFSFFS